MCGVVVVSTTRYRQRPAQNRSCLQAPAVATSLLFLHTDWKVGAILDLVHHTVPNSYLLTGAVLRATV